MEGLWQQVDGYCERTDFSFWAEPINALTNLAFLVAAFVMWRRVERLSQGENQGLSRAMCAMLAVIGIGSFLFHTFATIWAGLADTVPIGLFILLYVFASLRDYWRLPVWISLVGTLCFVPYAAITVPVFSSLPFFTISAPYWPVPLLILIFAVGLWRRTPETARGLLIGAVLLCVSLTFRTLDEPLCYALPFGTHFLWHGFNGLMLGWMIEVYRRHIGSLSNAA